MRVTVELDDDTADFYRNEAVERGMEVEDLLADRLVRAGALHPSRPYLIVTDADLTAVERELGGLPLRTCSTLIERVRRLAKVRFGEHTLALTPGQMEEIAWRAQKQGKTVGFLVKAAWDRFGEEFFTLIPGKR